MGSPHIQHGWLVASHLALNLRFSFPQRVPLWLSISLPCDSHGPAVAVGCDVDGDGVACQEGVEEGDHEGFVPGLWFGWFQ
jgi:hypothetical protein